MIYLKSFESNKKYKISVNKILRQTNRCINIEGGLES